MGIEKFIKTVCVQTAVYWGNPQNDGFGKMTFDDPVEIKCRWDESGRIRIDGKGKEWITNATLLVTGDLDIHGMVWLGTLDGLYDLYPDDDDPFQIPDTYEIMAKDKIPMIKSRKEFVRTVYLGAARR